MFFTIFWAMSERYGLICLFVSRRCLGFVRRCEAHLCRLRCLCSRWVVVVGVVLLSCDAFAIWLLQLGSFVVVTAVCFFVIVFYRLYCLLYVCIALLDQWLWWFQTLGLVCSVTWSINPEGFGWLKPVVLVVWTLQVSDVPDLLDPQVSRLHVCHYSATGFLFVLVLVSVIRMLMLERAECLLTCSGSCWHLHFVTVLAVNPFVKLKPYFFFIDSHFSYLFFLTWFRAYTRVR